VVCEAASLPSNVPKGVRGVRGGAAEPLGLIGQEQNPPFSYPSPFVLYTFGHMPARVGAARCELGPLLRFMS